jgi:hypothetical protein
MWQKTMLQVYIYMIGTLSIWKIYSFWSYQLCSSGTLNWRRRTQCQCPTSLTQY